MPYGKKSTLESGGSDPFIVLEDVNVEEAVKVAVSRRMWNAGQVCVSPKRILVEEKIDEKFLTRTKAASAKLKVGNSMDIDTTVAPVSSEKAANDVFAQIEKVCGTRT